MIAEYSDDNPVYLLMDLLPPLDDTIDYLYKYQEDFAYHYERGFYNLALFSYHQLYMAIFHMYLLKYHRIDVDVANSCRSGRPPIMDLTPSFYSDVGDEKSRVRLFGRRISEAVKKDHMDLVKQRDRIAHFTGDVLTKEQIDKHIEKSINVLKGIQPVAFYELLLHPSDRFTKHADEIRAEMDQTEKFYKISGLIRDFYLSKTDIDFLKAKPDFVFFDEYISKNGYEPIEG